MISQNEKKYRLYFILGVAIIVIGSMTAMRLNNNLIWIITGIIAIMMCVFLWIYRKKYDVHENSIRSLY